LQVNWFIQGCWARHVAHTLPPMLCLLLPPYLLPLVLPLMSFPRIVPMLPLMLPITQPSVSSNVLQCCAFQCSPMSSHVILCPVMLSHVLQCLPMPSNVLQCRQMFNLPMSSHVLTRPLMSSHVGVGTRAVYSVMSRMHWQQFNRTRWVLYKSKFMVCSFQACNVVKVVLCDL